MRIPEIERWERDGELLAYFIACSSGLANGFQRKRHWLRKFIKTTKRQIRFLRTPQISSKSRICNKSRAFL